MKEKMYQWFRSCWGTIENGGVDGRMRRAIHILIVLIAVMLVYPSVDLLAKSPSSTDSPTKYIVPPQNYPVDPPFIVFGNGDDEDSGDADDIAGLKDRDKLKGYEQTNTEIGTARLLVKIGWMYFFHRIF
jgi:hypothetical protein